VSDVVMPDAVDCVAITSANAVRHASPELISPLRNLPVVAVGARTAEAARTAGFTKVADVGGTAELLAASLIERTQAGAKIAYLCGTPRKPILEAQLQQSGRTVHAVETYATVRLVPDRARLEDLIEHGFDAALVYSAESAGALMDVLGRLPRKIPQHAAFVCLSADIARVLPADLPILIAQTPDEPSLLACLDWPFAERPGSR
jgi:uroporphyrinogen-III synthase